MAQVISLISFNYFISIFIFRSPKYWHISVFNKKGQFYLRRWIGFPGSKILDNSTFAHQLGIWAQETGVGGYTLARRSYSSKEVRYRCAGCALSPSICKRASWELKSSLQGCASAWRKSARTIFSTCSGCLFLTGTARRASFYLSTYSPRAGDFF